MKIRSTSRFAFFNAWLLIGFALCSVGALLVCAGLSKSAIEVPMAPAQPDISLADFSKVSACANTKLTHKIIGAAKHTYGYDIFAGTY
jgi:hypothetical protein